MNAFPCKRVPVEGYALIAPDVTKRRIFTSGDRRYAFSVFDVPRGVVLGSPSLLGRLDGGSFVWFDESYDYNQFDIQFESVLEQMAGQGITLHRLAGSWCVFNSKWATNPYHWVMECLTRIHYLERAGYAGGYMVPATPLAFETMALLGVDPQRIMAGLPHGVFDAMFEAETLVVCERVNGAKDTGRMKDGIRLCRQALVSGLPKGARRRIYIARRGETRRIVNEDALMALIEPFGFERVYMEDLAPRDQIALAHDSEAIIGPHGAGLIHTLFAEPGSLVLELASFSHGNGDFTNISRVMEHEYYQLPSQRHERVNISAPLDLVAMILSKRFG